MSVVELRERLKHIAGLCYGLSSDLSLLTERNAELLAENETLKAERDRLANNLHSLKAYRKKLSDNPELQRIKIREANRRSYEKRKREKLAEQSDK